MDIMTCHSDSFSYALVFLPSLCIEYQYNEASRVLNGGANVLLSSRKWLLLLLLTSDDSWLVVLRRSELWDSPSDMSTLP